MSNQQMTMGYGLSVLGGFFFTLGLGQLLPGSTADSALTASYLMQLAGWFASAGWLVQRAETHVWPFDDSPGVVTVIRKAISEICFPLALLLLLFSSVVFLVGLMLTPFILFVFSKLF